jgi:cytoskeletal protein CcmA (bactofilin family)
MALFSKNKVAPGSQSISTLITEGAVLDGNLTAPAFARIDGRVMGEVEIEQGLILGEKGVIIGNVTTKELVVYGAIQGNLHVQSLEIKSSGKITGEIKTQALSVENGAIYNGSLSMNHSKPAQLNGVSKPQPETIELVDELG